MKYNLDMPALVKPGDEVVVPDISGQFPVYWTQKIDGIKLSDKVSDLGHKPNVLHLAAMIGCNVEPLMRGDTVLEDVYRIEGGERAYVTGDQPPRITFTEIIPDHELTLEQAAENLRVALLSAIERRLSLGKVATSDCSGGFDSTTIAILAGAKMQHPIEAFVQYNPDSPAGDILHAREYVKGTNVHLNELRSGGATLPFTALDKVDIHDEPDPGATIHARIRARLMGARACGSELHFTGDGGDAVLDVPPNYLIDLARMGMQKELKEASFRYARLRHKAPQQIIEYAERNATRTLSDDLYALAENLQDPDMPTDTLTWISWPGQSLKLLTPEVRQGLSERAAQRAANATVPEGMGAADFVAREGLRSGGNVHRHLREIAATMGIETATPFMDADVVEACLRLPAYMRAHPYYFKNILRKAFDGILPSSLLSRTSKGSYWGELYKGLRASRANLEGLLEDSRLAALGVIDTPAVKREIEKADIGLPAQFPALDKIVSAELWLRGREG